MPRGSAAAKRAVRNADNLVNGDLRRYGYDCKRVLFVFVDDKYSPDRMACVVFSLGDNTLVVNVDKDGAFVGMSLYDVRTAKRLPRDFMYKIVGANYCASATETYGVRVYARNRTCYK